MHEYAQCFEPDAILSVAPNLHLALIILLSIIIIIIIMKS